MADVQQDWSADSNDALHISLIQPGVGGTKAIHTFNPKFTYPIFGDEERIFGYQGLKINLRYNACDMRPGLQITYTKKFKAVGETAPTDLKAILEDYLPKTAFEKSSVFDSAIIDPLYSTWTPPGKLWSTLFDWPGGTYEVWKGSLADPAVKQMIKRIQILVPLFIEGGTLVELDEPDWALERWTVFFLYEKAKLIIADESPYTFVGYCTVYRFYFHQPQLTMPSSTSSSKNVAREPGFDKLPTSDFSFSSQPCRSRISQFVILPPFQGGGYGSRFYNSIFDFYLKEPQTIEITVEDPNEAFDDLRDLNDLARLRRDSPEFANLRINSKTSLRPKGPVPKDIVDPNVLEKIRKEFKIAPRQFSRLVEMHTLSFIPTAVRQSLLPQAPSKVPDLKAREHEYHLWQLLTKQRLYRHNKDSLMQLERAERIEKLGDALGNVETDYARLLRTFDERNSQKEKTVANGTNGQSSLTSSKRVSPMDAEDDDEPSSKKIKFA